MRAKFLLIIGLAACASSPTPPEVPAEPIVIRQAEIETRADGRCFSTDPGPLVAETTIKRVLVVPEVAALDGTIARPPIYSDVEETVLVPAGDPTRFEIVCPQNFSQSFVASLQRALAARGAYVGEVNGLLDDQTRNAILTYQSTQGRRSANLALDTARSFGLVPA